MFTHGLGLPTTCLICELMAGTRALLQRLGKKELRDGLYPSGKELGWDCVDMCILNSDIWCSEHGPLYLHISFLECIFARLYRSPVKNAIINYHFRTTLWNSVAHGKKYFNKASRSLFNHLSFAYRCRMNLQQTIESPCLNSQSRIKI